MTIEIRNVIEGRYLVRALHYDVLRKTLVNVMHSHHSGFTSVRGADLTMFNRELQNRHTHCLCW